MQKIIFPLNNEEIENLKIGQEILFNGTIYTARDQAHKRLVDLINRRKKLPFDLKGQIIYYCGPTKTPKGKIIGACGPTTSSRMDEFTPALLKSGLKAMIGKGSRSESVIKVIKRCKAVYFIAPAGCAACWLKK
jgi:Tartrate dehydratase beta subunit/Fumarate hydratase class I, C-terminal domain